MGLSIPGLEQSRLHFWRIATHCDQCVRRRSTGFHFQFPLTQSFGDSAQSVPSKSSTLSTLSTFPPSKPLSIPRAPHSEPPPRRLPGPPGHRSWPNRRKHHPSATRRCIAGAHSGPRRAQGRGNLGTARGVARRSREAFGPGGPKRQAARARTHWGLLEAWAAKTGNLR